MKRCNRQHPRYFYLLLFCFLTMNCSGNKLQETNEFEIIRFDQDLYAYLTGEDGTEFLRKHSLFLQEYGEKVIHIGNSDSLGFANRLKQFFSEPTLMGIYRDEQAKYSTIESIKEELTQGFHGFFENFPEVKKPKIYMHVSGLNQNVIVSDDILSLSADKYLGADYPPYQHFFYDYQRQLMSPDRIVPDFLLGFMLANFPFEGKDDVLLDRILYEGKLRYILSVLLPGRKDWEYVGYNREQYEWCVQNEFNIWKFILENKHLYHPDYKTTQQYIREAPYTALLPSDSPARVGIWLGYRIIVSYMDQNPSVTLPQLQKQVDYQELLKQSRYRP